MSITPHYTHYIIFLHYTCYITFTILHFVISLSLYYTCHNTSTSLHYVISHSLHYTMSYHLCFTTLALSLSPYYTCTSLHFGSRFWNRCHYTMSILGPLFMTQIHGPWFEPESRSVKLDDTPQTGISW